MTATIADAAGERLAGRQVPRRRAVVAAVATGLATSVLVYRILRAPDSAG